jgi:nicotinate-nucleotide pyrophosphorylase (carboxylating)
MLTKELERFVEEDLGDDIYDFPDMDIDAEIISKEGGILAGLEEVKEIFSYFGLSCSSNLEDGSAINEGDVILGIHGSSNAILKAERLALNFLGRMSGIATITNDFVRKTDVIISGTRKTTPGFRKYEKRAILIGGGDPHRFNLSEMVMIKDSHIKILGFEEAIRWAKKHSFTKKVEVEVENVEDAIKAAKMGVDLIMFDNMDPKEIKRAITLIEEERIVFEASGRVELKNVTDFSKVGVDVVSVGALTHSARWLDFSLEIR